MVTISTTPRIYAVQGSQCYHINYASYNFNTDLLTRLHKQEYHTYQAIDHYNVTTCTNFRPAGITLIR